MLQNDVKVLRELLADQLDDKFLRAQMNVLQELASDIDEGSRSAAMFKEYTATLNSIKNASSNPSLHTERPKIADLRPELGMQERRLAG